MAPVQTLTPLCDPAVPAALWRAHSHLIDCERIADDPHLLEAYQRLSLALAEIVAAARAYNAQPAGGRFHTLPPSPDEPLIWLDAALSRCRLVPPGEAGFIRHAVLKAMREGWGVHTAFLARLEADQGVAALALGL